MLTSVAARSDLPWVLFNEPVMGAVAQEYLIWPDRAPALHLGFLDAIAALARRGNLVALSAAGHPSAVIEAAFEDVVVVRVGLDCDVTTLPERERGRDGRWGGIATSSTSVHDGWNYDARFDTGQLSPDTVPDEQPGAVDQTRDRVLSARRATRIAAARRRLKTLTAATTEPRARTPPQTGIN